MRRLLPLLPASLLLAACAAVAPPAPAPTPAPAVSGLEGRVIGDEGLVKGARVYAYRDFGDLLAFRPLAVSGPSEDNGWFTLDLPPGSYHLMAKRRAAGPGDGPLAVGDLAAYHGSNPVPVAPGSRTHVGFILVRKGAEVTYEEGPDPGSGSIAGTVTADGEPLRGADALLYLDTRDQFRGQVYSQAPPTGASGSFRMDLLPESSYFLIGRKRVTRRGVGPLSEGDYFGYFIDNPVLVKAGKVARLALELTGKAGEIGKEDSIFRATATQVRGRITDAAGKPVAGVYAFAYREKVMSHRRPDYISREADAEGRYVLYLGEGGTWYLGARSGYGEGPGMGEWYGRYDATADHSLVIGTGQRVEGVDIVVEEIARP